MSNRVLAEGVIESIHATTPHNRHRHPQPRISLSSVLGWAAVAALCLFFLAIASVSGS